MVKIYFDRFLRMVGNEERGRVVDRLPYLGLDIESVDDDSIRIEYNPNRPDFSTDYGIARALRGLMGVETGLPRYRVARGGVRVLANGNLSRVRPHIACAAARGLKLDDESIRQLISMQEDLHNGLGRKRKKVSIGLHNLDVIVPPVYYEGRPASYAFTPLGSSREMPVSAILAETKTGQEYAHILSGAPLYPILRDSNGMVLSFPPIINGTKTKVDTGTRNLFVDVTSTDEAVGEDALSVIAAALADMGAALESVEVRYAKRRLVTPDMSPTAMKLDAGLVRAITGLDITLPRIRACLRRSRLDVRGGKAVVPRYRVDILHPVDIAEEVAIGYGLDRLTPLYPPSREPGMLKPAAVSLDRVAQVMTQSGFAETMNYELVDDESLYANFGRSDASRAEVENPRSLEHHLLRDSVVPSLMSVLARNIKEEYPQRVFEVGRVYPRTEAGGVGEESHLGAAIAHASTGFSEAKMYLSALVRRVGGDGVSTRASGHWLFAEGRCAEVLLRGDAIGHVGEVKPSAVAAFGLEVPVSAFEIDLSWAAPE